jgi:hypothetical protein
MTPEEIEAIVIAEFNYWKAVDSSLAISAVGACANIYAAIKGFPAPWHPKPKGHKYCPDPDRCTYSDCPTAFCDRDKP